MDLTKVRLLFRRQGDVMLTIEPPGSPRCAKTMIYTHRNVKVVRLSNKMVSMEKGFPITAQSSGISAPPCGVAVAGYVAER
eukprot:scaffold28580_cov23-Tisochrysis_lutea.AAC.2